MYEFREVDTCMEMLHTSTAFSGRLLGTHIIIDVQEARSEVSAAVPDITQC